MRKGFLCTLLLWFTACGTTVAQYPVHHPYPPPPPRYYYQPMPQPQQFYRYPPPMAHGYRPMPWPAPRMMVGAPLTANGAVGLPPMRNGQPLTAQSLQNTIGAPPGPVPNRSAAISNQAHTTNYPSLQGPSAGSGSRGPEVVPVPLPAGADSADNYPADVSDYDRPYPEAAKSASDKKSRHGWGGHNVPNQVIDDAVCCEPKCNECPPKKKRDPCLQPRGYRIYGSAEFLWWWIDDQATPLGSPDDGDRIGGRATFGAWLNCTNSLGLEVSALYLDDENSSAFVGPARVDVATRVWSAELNLRKEILRCPIGHLDMLVGFRYFSFDEFLGIEGGAAPLLAETENKFYGGNFGLQLELRHGKFFVNTWGKLALGVNDAEATVSNVMGVFNPSDTEFAILPEVGAKVGACLTHNLRVTGGYSFLWLNNLFRPANVSGPAGTLTDSSFWAHGLTAGLEYRY